MAIKSKGIVIFLVTLFFISSSMVRAGTADEALVRAGGRVLSQAAAAGDATKVVKSVFEWLKDMNKAKSKFERFNLTTGAVVVWNETQVLDYLDSECPPSCPQSCTNCTTTPNTTCTLGPRYCYKFEESPQINCTECNSGTRPTNASVPRLNCALLLLLLPLFVFSLLTLE